MLLPLLLLLLCPACAGATASLWLMIPNEYDLKQVSSSTNTHPLGYSPTGTCRTRHSCLPYLLACLAMQVWACGKAYTLASACISPSA
jgi:hypothetical protein